MRHSPQHRCTGGSQRARPRTSAPTPQRALAGYRARSTSPKTGVHLRRHPAPAPRATRPPLGSRSDIGPVAGTPLRNLRVRPVRRYPLCHCRLYRLVSHNVSSAANLAISDSRKRSSDHASSVAVRPPRLTTTSHQPGADLSRSVQSPNVIGEGVSATKLLGGASEAVQPRRRHDRRPREWTEAAWSTSGCARIARTTRRQRRGAGEASRPCSPMGPPPLPGGGLRPAGERLSELMHSRPPLP